MKWAQIVLRRFGFSSPNYPKWDITFAARLIINLVDKTYSSADADDERFENFFDFIYLSSFVFTEHTESQVVFDENKSNKRISPERCSCDRISNDENDMLPMPVVQTNRKWSQFSRFQLQLCTKSMSSVVFKLIPVEVVAQCSTVQTQPPARK